MAAKGAEAVAAALRSGRLTQRQAAALIDGQDPRIRLRGRFPAGAKVELYKVAPGATSARGGELVDTQKVDKFNEVTFSKDIEVNWPYFVVSEIDGVRRQVRVTGKLPEGEKEATSRPSTEAAKPTADLVRDEEDDARQEEHAKRVAAGKKAARTRARRSSST